jgi:hypothetical protein
MKIGSEKAYISCGRKWNYTAPTVKTYDIFKARNVSVKSVCSVTAYII